MPRKTKETEKIGFSKKQLLKSKQFTIQEKDVVKVIMKDEKFSVKEAKEKIKSFLKRKVK